MNKKRDKLVADNMGLVHLCIKRFVGRGTDYDDLFQIGCIGLLKAATNFEEERGLKFSTYAVPVIIGEVKGFFRSDGLVKVSRSIKELSGKINSLINTLSKERGTVPTVSEIANVLNVPEEKVAEAMSASMSAVSLTASGEDGEAQMDIRIESGEEGITDRLSLWQAIEQLNDEEKKLIGLRYYMNKTQRETAELMGCSQVQISRKEKKILCSMRGLL